jgi:hypothetical protein
MAHFFGYYDCPAWDWTGRFMLALQAQDTKRYMQPTDVAVIGMLDRHAGDAFVPLAETTAWNWQQGAQAQWLDGDKPGRSILFNIRDACDPSLFRSRLVDTTTRGGRDLPMPIYSVTRDATTALCLNYSRLRYAHPTIGYAVDGEPARPADHPEDDGLFAMDLNSGESRLVVDLQTLMKTETHPSMDRATQWITHPTPSPNGQRVAFLHRYAREIGSQYFWSFRLCTVSIDGRDLRVLQRSVSPHDPALTTGRQLRRRGAPQHNWSHPHWYDDEHAMCWGFRDSAGKGNDPAAVGFHYYLFRDGSDEVRVLGEDCLKQNGHYTFCPANHDWMLSDTYPDAQGVQTLFLFHVPTGVRYDIARLGTDPDLRGNLRCDLHPR